MTNYELPSDQQRLDDWTALCAWLEEQSYNASYDPRCQGAYLTSAGSLPKNVEGAKALNRYIRQITAERKRLQVIYWAVGYGWRLHKDYREKLAAEQERINKL